MNLKTVLIGLLLGANIAYAIAELNPNKAEGPLQPFLIELMNQEHGKWKFVHPLGKKIDHRGEVAVTTTMAPGTVKEAVLRLDSTEFPGEKSHTVFKSFKPGASGEFELRSGGFSANLVLASDKNGSRGILSKIKLRGAVLADRIPVALYVSDGEKMVPVQLTGHNNGIKLMSNRISNVFSGDDDIKLHAVKLDDIPVEAEYVVTDYFRNKEIKRGKVQLKGKDTAFSIPLKAFGSFKVELKLPDNSASLRVTHIPKAQSLDPQKSFVGMNIFQLQTQYYSYQLPLFAQAGVRWVRPWLKWENTWASQEPRIGVFNTAHLDVMRRRLNKYNQKYIYILYKFSPVLGSAANNSPLNAEQMERWCSYVKRIVKHCPEIDNWEVWNEPDLQARYGVFTAPFYKKFLIESAKAIRAANPNAKVHGLSLSYTSKLPWLKKICSDSDCANVTDVVTLHTYAPTSLFMDNEFSRQKLLDISGFLGKPQEFNEIGATGYDKSPSFRKAYPDVTERNQAVNLPVNWAQSLYFGGPKGKAYWFCSIDPRDSSDPNGWGSDSSAGLLYFGLQPKTAFAAMAGMAKILDGHQCLGRMEIANTPFRYVAFSGNRAIVWSDTGNGNISAVKLGCLPSEILTVYDLFGNKVCSGKAEKMTLNLNDGPRYLAGCKQLGIIADAERKAWIKKRAAIANAEWKVGFLHQLQLKKGERGKFEFSVPANSKVLWKTSSDFPGKLQVSYKGTRVTGTVTATQSYKSGYVDFTIQLPSKNTPLIHRKLKVFVDQYECLWDGSFSNGNLNEYKVVQGVKLDKKAGASAPGCMRVDGSFTGHRIHHSDKLAILPGKSLHFSVTLKGKLSANSKVSFNIAFLVNWKWVSTWMTATLRDYKKEGNNYTQFTEQIPEKLGKWTTINATLPVNRLPKGETRIIFFIDVKDGKAGDYLLIDDLKIFQNLKDDDTGTAKLIYSPILWSRWKVQRPQGQSQTGGNLLLKAPFEARLVKKVASSVRRFRFKIRTNLNQTSNVKIALACFNGQQYLSTRILAATNGRPIVKIPRNCKNWTELSGTIPPLPENCNRCLLFINGKGKEKGSCEMSPIELSY